MRVMSDYENQYEKKTIKAADRFIDRIKDNILKKQTQPNSSLEYPIEKAAKSFDAFVESDQFKVLLQDDGR